MGRLAGWEIEWQKQPRRTEGDFYDRKDAIEYLREKFHLPAGMADKQVEKAANAVVLPYFEPEEPEEPWE